MRAFEILRESDEYHDITQEVINIIVRAKAEGVAEIQTSALVGQLSNMGYNANEESVMQALGDPALSPFIEAASEDVIQIKGADVPDVDAQNSAESSRDAVADMAAKAVMK